MERIRTSPLKTAVPWPDATPPGPRRKSRQVWIARHRIARELAAMARAPRAINRATPPAGPRAPLARAPARPRSHPAPLRTRLQQGWSPEQVRLAREAGRPVIWNPSTASLTPRSAHRTSGATICRGPSSNGAGGGARAAAPPPLSTVVPSSTAQPSPRTARPSGHWEADLMLFRTYGQAVGHSPRTPLPEISSSPRQSRIARALSRLLAPLPPPWRQTVTFRVRPPPPGTPAGPSSAACPLGIENAIGRLRRTLPRKTDLASLPAARFTQLVQATTNTVPRLPDPREVFWDPSHLECESTFPPIAGMTEGLRKGLRARE